jgi:stage IV sporulation protein FB
MLRFTLFKIPVSVHGFFFLLTAFLGGALRAQTPTQWHHVMMFMAAAFVSILIHELGHALTGLRFGAPSTQISLHSMGGAASFPGAHFSRKHRILMTAAGPGASIALATVFILLSIFVVDIDPQTTTLPPLVASFMSTLITINLFWSFINLCPVLPMDGGQILRDVLGPNRIKLTCIISFITLGLLAFLLWNYTHSIYNMVVMAFLGSYTWNIYRHATQQSHGQ